MKECEVKIHWENTDDVEKIKTIENLLFNLGISFDTFTLDNKRYWQFDWSLKGPIKVEFLKFKE